MTDFLTDHGIVIALVCAAAGVLYGAIVTKRLLALSTGNERMRRSPERSRKARRPT